MESNPNPYDVAERIAAELFALSPLWRTTDFDAELVRRWEIETGQSAADLGLTDAGRGRIANLGDWAKAAMTKAGRTVKLTIDGQEWRLWTSTIGTIHGQAITTVDHLAAVVIAAAERFRRA